MGRGRHVRRIPTRTKRRRISGLTASVALAAVAVIGIGALAVNSNGFEIDAGESVFPLADAYYSGTDGADDWAEGDSQDGVFLGVPTGSTPPLGAGALVAPDCYGSDIYTNASIDGAQTFICDGHSSNKFSEAENNIVSPAGKTPEDIWPIKAGNNSPKNEFSHAYAMFRLGDSICDADTDEDDLFLYLGGNRSNAEGEAFWGFELNQTPPNGFDQLVANGGDPFALNYNRTLDDLLISFTVEPGQNLLEVFEVTNVGVEGGTATFSPAVAGCFQGAPDGDSELQINVGDEVNDSRNGLDGAVLAPDWNIPVGDPTPKVIDGGDGGGNTFRLANGDNRGGDGHFLVAEKEFIEAAVDLQAFNIESQCFSSLIFTSRSSHPLESADLKDVAGGYANLCDASIQIAPDDVNEVGDDHTFTVTANQVVAGVAGPAPDGTIVSVTLTDSEGAVNAISTNTCAAPGTVGGTCTITFSSDSPGTVTGHASTTLNVLGDSLFVETDGVGSNSGDAMKHFVDASVTIAADDVNVVGNSHTFTVTVTPDAPTGVTVTSVSITPTGDTGDITAETCSTKTATALTCDITVNSTATGSASIGADVTVVFDDDSSTNTATVNVSTDGITPNSGPAVKHWVDASVTIGVDDTNNLNESHTFTATVTPSYPAGVTITSVSITPTGDTGLITAENCDEAGAGSALTCDITVNSGVAATATIGVDVAVVFDDDSSTNTATVNVSTDGTGSNSGAATKTWVDGSLVWHKVDELGNPLAGATFEVCQTHVLNTATNTYDDITDVCFSVTDNTAPDADPADGEFLIDDVILGRYTVRETAAPAGYIIILNTAVAFPDQTLIAPDVEIVTPFVNTPPLEGCTPGWWWNNGFAAWDEPTDPVAQAVAAAVAATWGGELDYVAVDGTMNSLFKDVFSLTDGEMAALGLPLNWTLWDAINANGGQFNALQRHGVSALLNSVSVAFEFSAGQVLVDMNVALADGIWNDQALLNSYSNANERNHDNCPQGGDTALTSASLPWGAGLFSLLMLPIAVKRGRHRRQRRLGRG